MGVGIDEGHDLIPLGPEGSFESHICYGSVPIAASGLGGGGGNGTNTIREYYFGGDVSTHRV